jgi:hypothetical protein
MQITHIAELDQEISQWVDPFLGAKFEDCYKLLPPALAQNTWVSAVSRDRYLKEKGIISWWIQRLGLIYKLRCVSKQWKQYIDSQAFWGYVNQLLFIAHTTPIPSGLIESHVETQYAYWTEIWLRKKRIANKWSAEFNIAKSNDYQMLHAGFERQEETKMNLLSTTTLTEHAENKEIYWYKAKVWLNKRFVSCLRAKQKRLEQQRKTDPFGLFKRPRIVYPASWNALK